MILLDIQLACIPFYKSYWNTARNDSNFIFKYDLNIISHSQSMILAIYVLLISKINITTFRSNPWNVPRGWLGEIAFFFLKAGGWMDAWNLLMVCSISHSIWERKSLMKIFIWVFQKKKILYNWIITQFIYSFSSKSRWSFPFQELALVKNKARSVILATLFWESFVAFFA